MENQQQTTEKTGIDITVRPLRESDLPVANRVYRLAFGTLHGHPDPMKFDGDADLVRTRWLADPTAAFGAELGGELVGSNFATNWGSVGLFGPLSVHPDLWDRGIGKRLLEPVMELFVKWGIKHAGLVTSLVTPKNVALYQNFGFWPRFLTAAMSKSITQEGRMSQWSRYSEVPKNERAGCLSACRDLTDAVYKGLDLEREIRVVDTQGLGDTVLLWDDAGLYGLAVCHCGAGSEAGSSKCYVKFGAVQPGPTVDHAFDRLLDACEALSAEQGMSQLLAGVNTACHKAYQKMIAHGFRIGKLGVTMHRPNELAYHRPGVYTIDDWR